MFKQFLTGGRFETWIIITSPTRPDEGEQDRKQCKMMKKLM